MLEAEDKSFITLNAAEGAGRSAWVLGLGASGRAAAQYLNDHGWRVHAFDTREAPAGLDAFCKAVPGCEMTLGGFPETTARQPPSVLQRAKRAFLSSARLSFLRRSSPI